MTAYALISLYLLLLATLAAGARAEPDQDATPTQIAQQIVQTWRCQDQYGTPRTRVLYTPWGKHTPAFRTWQLNTWTHRLTRCRQALHERARQWNWQQWLPDKWRRIAICETQLNWRHQNSSYEGAFGFATSSWDTFKPVGYPDHASQATPWQQYQVALAIWRRYGFSGWGCRGA